MRIKYLAAPDVKVVFDEITDALEFTHIRRDRVVCLRSVGSKARRVSARIHALSRVWQMVLSSEPYYIVEVLSEQYDRMSEREKERVLIHEALHIPKSFGGGLRAHEGFISSRHVEDLHRKFLQNRAEGNENSGD